MRTSLTIAAAVAIGALATCPAAAQSFGQNPPTSTLICLDVSGRSLPAVCRVPASRLDASEDYCTCPALGLRVVAPICAPGVKPPADTAAYERARLAAVKDGSVVGAQWKGQPMCEANRLSRDR